MEESAPLISSMTTWFTPTVLFIFLNLMIATILFTSNNPNKQPPSNNKPTNQNDTVARSPSILHRLKSFNLYPYRSQDDPSSSTLINHHDQQALELAATQFVFSHPFSDEQDLQPSSANPKRFGFDPTRIEKEALQVDERFIHDQDLQQVSTNPKRFDFDPTHFDFDPTRMENEAPLVNENDYDPTRIENEGHDEEDDTLESLDEVYSKITGGHVNRTKSDTLLASGEVPVKLPAKMKKSASMKSAFGHFEEDKIVEARRPATVRERRVAEDDDVEVDSKADDFINKFKHQLKLQRLDSIIRYKDMVNRGGEK